jgi:septum formation protein
MTSQLILASASPRRKELLSGIGVDFTIHPPSIDESQSPGELPFDFVKRLSLEKSLAIAVQSSVGTYVLGADTIVVIDNIVLGKPRDEAQAAEYLGLIQGKTHQVLTGVCVSVSPDQILWHQVVYTNVTMRPLSLLQIQDYIATGEPLDKAGAYAAQGMGRSLITHIDGSLNNVIGLPVELLIDFFKKHKLLL